MKFQHHLFRVILIIIFFFQTSAAGFSRFARNMLSRTTPAQKTALASLYAMRTYERTLPDGTVQQLHVGSDDHVANPAEKKQVQDLVDHAKKHSPQSCKAITEDMKGPSEHQKSNPRCPDIFLHEFPRACAESGIPHRNVEFRGILFPGNEEFPNNITMRELLVHFENYANRFKHDAITRNILTKQDFEHIRSLRKELAPYADKTVQTVCVERGVGAVDGVQKRIYTVAHKLIEDCALYHAHKDQKSSHIYLNMGGWHINFKDPLFIGDCLSTRFAQKGWKLAHTSGAGIETEKEFYQNSPHKPVDVAQHFTELSRFTAASRAQTTNLFMFFGT